MAGRSAIVSSEFCLDKEVELVMRQEWCTAFGGFTVKDTSGNDVFKVENSSYGHKLLDMSGRLIAELRRKCFAMRHTMHIYTGPEGQDRKVTLNLRNMKIYKKAHVYILQTPLTKDDPTELDYLKPDIKIESETSNFFKVLKEVKIYDTQMDEEYARMSKTSTFNYVLKVKPGVDHAFMCLCAVFFNSVVKNE